MCVPAAAAAVFPVSPTSTRLNKAGLTSLAANLSQTTHISHLWELCPQKSGVVPELAETLLALKTSSSVHVNSGKG